MTDEEIFETSKEAGEILDKQLVLVMLSKARQEGREEERERIRIALNNSFIPYFNGIAMLFQTSYLNSVFKTNEKVKA